MRNIGKSLLFALAAVSVCSFAPPKDKIKKKKFIDPANMDQSVKPGDNFYLYANGTWIKNNPVPSSQTRWGSFNQLALESAKRMQTLLQDAASTAAKNPKMQKVGDFYASGIDSAAIEAKGYQPIKADLDKISNLKNLSDMLDEVAYLRVNGAATPLLAIGIGQDRKEATKYIAQIGQGGTSLPDRDYYLKNDSRSLAIRKAYQSYITNIFSLIGKNGADASKGADAVMRIETAMAKAQMSRVELRDQYKTYNKFSWKELSATTPSVDWKSYADKLMIKGLDSVIVTNPAYLKSVDMLLTAIPLDDWKTYLQWHVVSNAAPYMSNAFVKENFAFSQVLSGQKEMTPRPERISRLIDGSLGDLLGQLYVEKFFKPEAKQRMQELVNNLQQTFADRIKKLDWMSEETKQRGLEKLNAFTKKIAYPDKWKDYATVAISKDNFLGNIQQTRKFDYQEMIGHIGKPVDKSLWGMTPPTINAYYSPVGNEIVFPAAILQFPFFDFDADDAVNYGGIGAVIGHEMTHGFDDQGRQYAGNGNLSDWWTKDDADKFKSRADKVVAQYNDFTVLDSLHVNGRLTLGENLADLGGLNIAYEAFMKTNEFKENKKIDGFTPTQRFFLNWAQVWRSNTLPEQQAQLILIDPHSPGMARANGPIANIDAWYDAFNIKEGDKMFVPKGERIHIW